MLKPQNTTERLKASFDGLRNTPTFRFFGLAFVAYVVWSVAYEQVLKPSTTLDEVVIEHMVSSTEAVFEAVGWPVGTYPQPATHRDRVGWPVTPESKSAPRATASRSLPCSRFSSWPFPGRFPGRRGSSRPAWRSCIWRTSDESSS